MKLTILIKRMGDEGSEHSQIRNVDFQRPVWSIGRENTDIETFDPHCSAQHAILIQAIDGSIQLRDLSSRNGTYLDGEKVKIATIEKGNVIRVGRTEITVLESNAKPIAEARPKGNVPVCRTWPENFACLPKELQSQFTIYQDAESKQKE